MMTGRLSVRAGIGFVGSGSNGVFTDEAVGCLPSNETTMPEALKRSDPTYMTFAVGKWHLGQRAGCLPTERGFDKYFGIPFSCDMGISGWNYHNHSSPPFAARPLPLLNDTTIIEQPVNLATLSDRYVGAALGFIEEAKTAARPFLLYIPWNHVHNPNFRSLQFCNSSKRGSVGDAAQELDHAVGKLVAGVGALGMDENIVWFFTSDNGAPLGNDHNGNGPLLDGKFTTWEGGVREPAFITWKGTVPPGGMSDALTGTYDIFATIMAIAGVAPPTDRVIDGMDLTPLLMDPSHKASGGHDCIFHYHSPQSNEGNTSTSPFSPSGVAAVRCGKYKAHFFTHSTCQQYLRPVPDGAHEPPVVFDLDVDLKEQHPMYPNSSNAVAAAVKMIRAALKAHLATVKLVPNQMIPGGPHPGGDLCDKTTAPTCVGGNNISYAVCKDIDSKIKFPQWPVCTFSPQYYGSFACQYEENQKKKMKCMARCMPPGEQGAGPW